MGLLNLKVMVILEVYLIIQVSIVYAVYSDSVLYVVTVYSVSVLMVRESS